MSDNDSRSNPWHWYEYEVGLLGEIARAFARNLVALLIGLGAAFVLILSVGLLAEQDLLGDPGLGIAVDHLGRFSVGVLLVLVPLAWAGSAVAAFVREVTTSRALVRAAARGASRQAVPSPEQVESVTRQPAEQLSFFGWANAAVVGGIGVIGLIVVLVDPADSETLVIMLAVVGYALVMALLGFAGPRWLTPAHERRQARIAAHWSVDDEGKAWRPAKQARRDRGQAKSGGVSASSRLIYAATTLWGVGFAVLAASITMRCGRVPGRVSTECEEITYSSVVESVLAWGFWVFAVLMPVATLLAVAGSLLDWKQRRGERAELRGLLADPYSSRPDERLLSHHARRRTHPLALVGSAMAGLGLVLGLSAYLLGKGWGLGSQEVFAGLRTEALSAVAVSVGLFLASLVGTGIANVRGRGLRNELMRRWPTAPSWSANSEGRVLRAKRGPALHGQRYVKVGKNASSGR